MRNKTLKLSFRFVAFLFAMVTMLSLVACGGDNPTTTTSESTATSSNSKFSLTVDLIKTSVSDANVITYTSVITDNNVEVKKIDKTITVDRDGGISAMVRSNVETLNSSFELTSVITYEEINEFDPNTVFTYNLEEGYMSNIEVLSDAQLKGTVKAENAKTFFNAESLDVKGDCSVEFNFEDGKLVNYKISYTTASNRVVNINCVYTY